MGFGYLFGIGGRSSPLDAPVEGDDHSTMYVILWRFRPLMGRESEFERAYGPSSGIALLSDYSLVEAAARSVRRDMTELVAG